MSIWDKIVAILYQGPILIFVFSNQWCWLLLKISSKYYL